MAQITLGGNPAETIGNIPANGTLAPEFELTNVELGSQKRSDFQGSKLVLNIFPSVNTGVCAASVRAFNEKAASMDNTKVLCISRDLPFAQQQFCAAEGLDGVIMLSDFKTHQFGKDYGLEMRTSAFQGLLSRVVMVLDENGTVVYGEQVPEIGQEPNYEAALNAL